MRFHLFYLSLVSVAALEEICAALSPPKMKEHVKRIAAVLFLLALVRPALMLYEKRSELRAAFPSAALSEPEAGARYRETAEAVFRYAERRYGLARADIGIAFSEEDGTLNGARLFLPRCPYAVKAALAKDLTEQLGVPVVLAD